MSVTIEKQGRRIYLIGNTFPLKDRIKAMGGHWDGDRRAWWVGSEKADAVTTLLQGGAEQAEESKPEDPADIRLYGKVKYKGRTYYARFIGETKRGYSARLVTLDLSLDFWVSCARPGETQHDGSEAVGVVVKTYAPREYRGRTEYTTVRSIQRFIEKQSNPATARGECSECGEWGPVGQTCKECCEGTHMG